MKKIAALVLALMISLTAVSALADTLVMCTNASFPPYEYVEGDKASTPISPPLSAKSWATTCKSTIWSLIP